LDSRSLLYFIAVAEEKNVCRAARRAHITQPALTRQIHSLENDVGVPLFVRSATGMEITAAGMALLRHARNIQAELEQARDNARRAVRTARQPFDVGISGPAMFNVMPRLLAGFVKRNPLVELRLHQARKDHQLRLLREGKIQLAFDYFPLREPDMAYELAYREQFWVALHKNHRLAKKEIIDIGELADEPRVGSSFDVGVEEKLIQVYGSIVPRVEHRADNMLTALTLVSGGLCVCFAPPSLRSLRIPDVVYRPCSGFPDVPFDLVCMYRKDERGALLSKMLETVRAFRAASMNVLPPPPPAYAQWRVTIPSFGEGRGKPGCARLNSLPRRVGVCCSSLLKGEGKQKGIRAACLAVVAWRLAGFHHESDVGDTACHCLADGHVPRHCKQAERSLH
jgi:DNA-binding transcriptional LysR family regulator